MRAEIIAVGTEILLGEIVDTNSAYIASQLPSLGIDVYFKHTVGDNLQRLTDVIARSREENDVVIMTGGLGPTEDDLTREAIAAVHNETPQVDAGLEKWLRDLFDRRSYNTMPERNLKQAWLIPSARPINNPRGTAPGWWAERDGKIVIAMPGPPQEMTRMWDEEVAPELHKRAGGSILVKRTLKTVGVGEGNVDEILSPLLSSTNPSIGIYARGDGVHVRIGAKAATHAQGMRMIEPVEARVRDLLGAAIWGVDDETFESVIGDLLRQRGLTLATMESCSGGLLAHTITNISGSSDYFRGGIVSYATEVKEAMGVDPASIAVRGVYSPETAAAMAEAARHQLKATIGIGITGVAGSETVDGVASGQVYIGLSGGGAVPDDATSFLYPSSREGIKRRAVTQALMLLRRALV